MITASDISDLSLDVKEIDGKYVLALSSGIAVATKGEPIRKETGSRNIAIVFFVSLAVTVALDLIGMWFQDPIFGRTLVYLGEFPAILVNIISARYIIKSVS